MSFRRLARQFEDFASHNALALIDRYRDNYLCFNDDIQGTGYVEAGYLRGSGSDCLHPARGTRASHKPRSRSLAHSLFHLRVRVQVRGSGGGDERPDGAGRAD